MSKVYEFNRSLKGRGLSLAKLAAAIGGTSHAHLSKVCNNLPGRGKWTRRRLAPLLTPAERALLGWDAKGNLVEQSSTGNSRPQKGEKAA